MIMGDHINKDGKWQSDKFPTTPPDCVPLKVTDPAAQDLLWEYAKRRRAVDGEFSDDLESRLVAVGYAAPIDNRRIVVAIDEFGGVSVVGGANSPPEAAALARGFNACCEYEGHDYYVYVLPDDADQMRSEPNVAEEHAEEAMFECKKRLAESWDAT